MIPFNIEVEGANPEVEGANPEVEGANLEFEGANSEFEGAIAEAIEGAVEGVRKSTKDKLTRLVKGIYENEGRRIPDYASITAVPEKTIESYISKLREVGFVEFIGESSKKGGYHLTLKLKILIGIQSED